MNQSDCSTNIPVERTKTEYSVHQTISPSACKKSSGNETILSKTVQPSHKTVPSLELPMACLPTVESSCWWSSHWRFWWIVCYWLNQRTTATVWAAMMFSLHVYYPPCFVSSKFDFTSLFSVREKRCWTNFQATLTMRRARNLNRECGANSLIILSKWDTYSVMSLVLMFNLMLPSCFV